MTVTEKRKKLQKYCDKRYCPDCKLTGKTTCSCGCGNNFESMSEAEAIGAYEILFGDETPETIKHRNGETTIVVKSARAIDSVDIYFKEDK